MNTAPRIPLYALRETIFYPEVIEYPRDPAWLAALKTTGRLFGQLALITASLCCVVGFAIGVAALVHGAGG